MADSPHEAGEPPAVEMFGALELKLNSSNSTGYCDVYPLKGRKKKPFQAKIYRPWRKDFINLGTFAKAHEAAVAVARQRFEGIEDFPSPDKSRAENSTLPRPASFLYCLLSLICRCSYLMRQRSKSLWRRRPSPSRRLLQFKTSKIGLRSCQSRSRSRGQWPQALVPLQQATLALRCPRPRLHLSRRHLRALWSNFPMVGGSGAVEPPPAHAPGIHTQLGRVRDSIEATIHVVGIVLIQG